MNSIHKPSFCRITYTSMRTTVQRETFTKGKVEESEWIHQSLTNQI